MAIKHITLRQLEVFREVVREGSVSQAARRLHLTQPTVSIQLRKLADHFRVELLEYRGGKLQATDEGRELFLAAGDMLIRLQEMEARLQHLRTGTHGRLSIAMVTTANYVVPRLLGPFGHRFPNVELALFTGNRQEILQRFERQTDDLYIFSHPPASSDAEKLPFLRNPLVLIAPPDHPAAQRRRNFDFRQLMSERILLREQGSGTGWAFQSWLDRHDIDLENTLQVASNEGIFLSVAGGMGLAVISEHVIRSRLESVAVLPVKGFPLESHWYLVHQRQRRISPVAQAFLDFLKDQLQRLEPDYARKKLSDWHA